MHWFSCTSVQTKKALFTQRLFSVCLVYRGVSKFNTLANGKSRGAS
jgi:hypothetical protein